MQIYIYHFVNSKKAVIVSDEMYEILCAFDRFEHANDERHRSHRCFSLDAVLFESDVLTLPLWVPEDSVVEKELFELLDKAIASLTDTQKERFELSLENKSGREIARIEGVDEKAIRKSLAQAKKKISAFLKNYKN